MDRYHRIEAFAELLQVKRTAGHDDLAIVPAAEDETLKTLRSGVEMLVVVSDQSYVPVMIAALGG